MKGEGGDRTWGCDACEGEALGVVVAVGMGIALELELVFVSWRRRNKREQ